jgi:hypothetical protein
MREVHDSVDVRCRMFCGLAVAHYLVYNHTYSTKYHILKDATTRTQQASAKKTPLDESFGVVYVHG